MGNADNLLNKELLIDPADCCTECAAEMTDGGSGNYIPLPWVRGFNKRTSRLPGPSDACRRCAVRYRQGHEPTDAE
jgi:hypothetical protein